MKSITTFCLVFLLLTAAFSFATCPEPDATKNNKNNKGGGFDGGMGGFFGPGAGFNIPGFGNRIVGRGYGGGYGGPNGGYWKGGIMRPTVVCREKGPCYKKELTCPAKCFHSYSRSGEGYGGGGGGGGCTMDCKNKCNAYC